MNRAERRRLAKQRETRKGAPGRDTGARLVEIMRRGIECYQAGRLAEAEQSFRTFLESIPDDADAHHLLGVVLYRAGRHQDAVAHIRKSIDFAPENASFHNNLGNVLNDLGRTDEAFDCFSRAVAIDPGLAEAHNNLGNLLKDRARADEAIRHFERALALNPEYAEAHNNLGNLIAGEGRLDDAVACFQKALVIRPEFADAHNALGNVLKDRGRPDEAAACYEKALAFQPDHVDARNNLGNVFLNQGRLDDALETFRRTAEIDPAGSGYAQHMVAAITGETTESAPADYVRKLFDGYAPRFDAHLVGELGYAVPEMMRRAVDRSRGDEGVFGRALDLGCGTGLVGEAFRELVQEFHGVDRSARMLDRARRKGVYDAVHLEDVHDCLGRCAAEATAFHLVLAAELFIYISSTSAIWSRPFKVSPKCWRRAGCSLFRWRAPTAARSSCSGPAATPTATITCARLRPATASRSTPRMKSKSASRPTNSRPAGCTCSARRRERARASSRPADPQASRHPKSQ